MSQSQRSSKLMNRSGARIDRSRSRISRFPSQNKMPRSNLRTGRNVSRGRASLVRLALKGLIGLVLAACLGAAAIAWQSHGDAVKAIFASRASQSDLTSSLAPKNLDAEKTSPPAVQATATRAARPQPTFLAQMAPEGAAPTNAAPPSELQSMGRDLAAIEQKIEQLKIGQAQIIRDNAAFAEQLKASQQQMARDSAAVAEQLKANEEQIAGLIARASEEKLRPKITAPPPRPIANRPRKPVPLSKPQARAQPTAPIQAQPEQQ
jgi:hypothetical protein